MTAIEAEVKKDKKSKKTTYSFEANNESFEAHYFTGKKPKLEIMHNGSLLGTIDNPKAGFECVVNSETGPIKISAWINNRNSISAFLGKINGIGIEIDGKPVQYTLADPEIHIKNGRSGLYFLLFVLGFKCIWTFSSVFEKYTSYVIAGVSSAIYIIPLLIVLTAAVQYKNWTAFAIIAGIIFSLLEMLDYVTGIPAGISSGANGATFVIWILIRVSALYLLYNAWKWKRKQKKYSSSTPGAS
jgi:hypothetical protein